MGKPNFNLRKRIARRQSAKKKSSPRLKPSESRPNLNTLPAETLLQICEHLETYQRMVLPLICKSIFRRLGIVKGSTKDDYIRYGILLEHGNPSLSLCFACARLSKIDPSSETGLKKFHDRCATTLEYQRRYELCAERSSSYEVRLRRPLRTQPWYINSIRSEVGRYRSDSWMPTTDGPRLCFSKVHQVMKRHILGPGYGLPIDQLESFVTKDYSIPWKLSSFDERYPRGMSYYEEYVRPPPRRAGISPRDMASWSSTHKQSAKIIDDKLYICRSHRLEGPGGCKDHVATALGALRLPVCVHLPADPTRLYEYLWPEQTEEGPLGSYGIGSSDREGFFEDGEVGWFESPGRLRRSCALCFTDYESNRYIMDGRFYLELRTYHCLGDCYEPNHCREWKRLVTFPQPRPVEHSVWGLIREQDRGLRESEMWPNTLWTESRSYISWNVVFPMPMMSSRDFAVSPVSAWCLNFARESVYQCLRVSLRESGPLQHGPGCDVHDHDTDSFASLHRVAFPMSQWYLRPMGDGLAYTQWFALLPSADKRRARKRAVGCPTWGPGSSRTIAPELPRRWHEMN